MSIARIRKEIVFERLLARLTVVAPGRWVLKGGLALDFRLGAIARATNDMDLARADDARAATRDLQEAVSIDLDDYFVFTVEETDKLDQLTTGTAIRYKVVAELAGRIFEQVVVDVGFGSVVVDTADSITAPDLLGFAGIEPVTVSTLPLELHVAGLRLDGMQGGEVVRARVPGDVGVAPGVNRHRRRSVEGGPAEVAAVHDPACVGVELGDEGIGAWVPRRAGHGMTGAPRARSRVAA